MTAEQRRNTPPDLGDENTVFAEGSGPEAEIVMLPDGKQIVWIENSALTNREIKSHKAVASYITNHIGEVYTLIESGQKVYLGENLPTEYTQSKYVSRLRGSNQAALRAKNKAVGNLGEMIEIATNRRWEKTKHPDTKDAKYGMYRYDSTFAFPVKDGGGVTQKVRAYDVELLIRNASDGKKYLYDIVNIKENTTAAIDLTERETRLAAMKAAPRGSVSMDTVSQDGENVKRKFSLKTDSEGRKEQQFAAIWQANPAAVSKAGPTAPQRNKVLLAYCSFLS